MNLRPKESPGVADLLEKLRTADPALLVEAVTAEAQARMAVFVDGVNRYRRSPTPERPPEPPVIWSQGSARLLDYGVFGAADGPPLLCIPSLVNRAHVLDLSEDRSLLRFLAGAGYRPLLLDWGSPDAREQGFTLSDYVDGLAASALDFIAAETKRRADVLGLCMGGTLALGLATVRADAVGRLVLLATPWDFHADQAQALPFLSALKPALDKIIENLGMLPVDVMQALFLGLNPALVDRKFRRFASLDPNSPAAREFVTLEDWLNDGIPLAGPVARECLFGWYMDNTPARGEWKIADHVVDPAAIKVPAFVAVPDNDHIVPPPSARPLSTLLAQGHLHPVPAGHIGMIAGARARALLYQPLKTWLDETAT